MVDFKKLKSKKTGPSIIDPVELFRRMPKPKGVNDLYSSQSEVLSNWFARRKERDTIIKLHTGGGKTMVGLLIAQSTMNELGGPVLYLAPTKQLVKQTLEKAQGMGIPAVSYISGQNLHEDFVNGKAVMVASYHALFNGFSKFGIQGRQNIQQVSAIILDDAHAAFPVVRDCFTFELPSNEVNREEYLEICSIFRKSFIDIDRVGTFDEVIDGDENIVLEVPYWAWKDYSDTVRTKLTSSNIKQGISWPLLRDNFHLCHAFVSRQSFSITPIQPMINMFPTFSEAPRRIYMSATIADDSDIVRTFNVSEEAVKNSLSSKSVAGISERMILVPDLMSFSFQSPADPSRLLSWVVENNCGAVILVPSDKRAENWKGTAKFAKGSTQVEQIVSDMQRGKELGPVVFSNRYDGIDLPGNSCRLLIMDGLPMGTSSYEVYRATALMGGEAMSRMMAQRIEQGLGRGARGFSDYCVDILVGADLTGWIGKNVNFSYFTSATKAQIEMGISISKEVENLHDLSKVIAQSLSRDSDWLDYYSEELVDYLDQDQLVKPDVSFALVERKAVNLWQDGYHDKAISKITKFLHENSKTDIKGKGWLEQLIARIAYSWDNKELAVEYQKQAYSDNRNLFRPLVKPAYVPLTVPGSQATTIVDNIGDYRNRRSLLKKIENIAAYLTPNATSNQFEQALADLGEVIGFTTERFDEDGVGPDVLWLLDNYTGIVFEAKSRKKEANAFRKNEHGQLLVAEKWFKENYPKWSSIGVSVHPDNKATLSAQAENTYVLTYDKLTQIVADTKVLIERLIESSLDLNSLVLECEKLLNDSSLRSQVLEKQYLTKFKTWIPS